MRLPFCTMMLLFLIGMDVFNYQWWGSAAWNYGFLAGVTLAIAWWVNKQVGVLLGIVGVGLLFFLAADAVPIQTEQSGAHFNGVSVGMIIGVASLYLIHWKAKGKRMLTHWMRMDGFDRAAIWLDKTEDANAK